MMTLVLRIVQTARLSFFTISGTHGHLQSHMNPLQFNAIQSNIGLLYCIGLDCIKYLAVPVVLSILCMIPELLRCSEKQLMRYKILRLHLLIGLLKIEHQF